VALGGDVISNFKKIYENDNCGNILVHTPHFVVIEEDLNEIHFLFLF